MKRISLFFAIIIAFVFNASNIRAQIKLIPSNIDIGNAVKQALEQGTGKSSDQLSAVDGFFKNVKVKPFFPPEAQQAEKTLRSLG